jgi:hypothetical protein
MVFPIGRQSCTFRGRPIGYTRQIMELLSAYLPIDRGLAVLRGKPLGSRSHGAALSADVSGFTLLAEALV